MDSILNSLSYFFWVAIALGILVTVHELGHFLTARLFGMRVDAFSIGFGRALVRKVVGDTEYKIGWIPLGGYVKIHGMVDESMDVPYEMQPAVDADGRPVLDADGDPVLEKRLDARGRPVPAESSVPEPDEYRAKPVWQRMVVITAGVVFNIVLAFLIYSGLAAAYGRAYTPAENVRLDVTEGSIAAEMGLRDGDRVVAANGERIEKFEDAFSPTTLSADPLRLTVERGGREVEITGPDALMTRLSQRAREADDHGQASFGALFGAVPRLPPVLAGVAPGSAAERAGLRAGDRVVSIDGEPISSWMRLTSLVGASEGRPLRIQWARADTTEAAVNGAGEPVERVGTAGGAAVYEALVAPAATGERYVLGVELDAEALGVEYETYGLGEALAAGARQTWAVTSTYAGFVGKLFAGKESVRENVGGPIMIAQQSKQAADRGGDAFWGFVAILSVALAVFNILPIPALDGGHLVFLLYEAVARREPSLRVRMVVQQVGLVLILAFMAFAIFNDVSRWVG